MRVAIAAALMGLFVMTATAGAPISGVESQETQDVIVVFNDDLDNPAQAAADLTRAHGGQLGFVYEHALKGFSGTFSSRAVAAIERNPQVAYVEVDQLAHTAADTSSVPVPTGIDRVNADQNSNLDIDGNDDLSVNTVVAVIDTGIDFQHSDLNVNTEQSVDCSGGSPFSGSCSTGGDDDNGHGTHVAGTIGALDDGPNYSGEVYTDVHVVGVAPGVEQWAVKVLRSDGSGYISWIVAGIDYVTANAPANGGPITVANMSLGCECSSSAMDDAISKSVAAGVTYAVAAGNSAKDASTFSPANHPDVITVSALADFDGEAGASADPTCRTDEDDTLANFSNFGSEIEVTAPGVCILSAWNDGGYNIISGTSMASPHAAGAAALLAASGVSSPSQISSTLQSTGNTEDWTDEIDGTEEPRVDVADSAFNPDMTGTDSGGDGDGDNTAPVANDVSRSGDEDTEISWSPDVSDADGDPLSCTIATQPANGAAFVASDCSSGSYTPDADYNGTDSFTYRVSDGSATDDGTVSVTINPINDAPVANDDSYSTATDTSLNVAAPGVLGNDSDVDGDSLTVSAVDTSSTSGTVTWASDGSFTYDPPADFTGTDTFGYTASDPSGATDTGTVTIEVGSSTTMHVGDLDATSLNGGSTWSATVTILVLDNLGNPVDGADVLGTWTQSGTGSNASCTTGSSGTCTVSSGSIHKRISSTTWSVDNVTHASLSYDSNSNTDPDGDSDGTSITVSKP